MKKILGAVLALFLLVVAPTSALAPSKPREITNFHPVVLDVDVIPYLPPTFLPSPTPFIKLTEQPTVRNAKAYALDRLGSKQFSCINNIFIRESHWNTFALNKSSGAYGIPQALPGSKMAVSGSDWRTNPVTQVRWGIRYVNGRYGSACDAWRFHQVHGWY